MPPTPGFIPPKRSFHLLQISAAEGFGIKAQYSPIENVPNFFDHKFIFDRYSPKRAAVIDRYSRLPQDRLSWYVVTNIGSKKIGKAVLRNRAKRRWASAFTEALKNHGFYHNGRKRTGPNHPKNYEVGLRGTLEILVFSDRGVIAPYRELVGASNFIVKGLIRKINQLKDKARSDQAVLQEEGKDFQASNETPSSIWSLWRTYL